MRPGAPRLKDSAIGSQASAGGASSFAGATPVLANADTLLMQPPLEDDDQASVVPATSSRSRFHRGSGYRGVKAAAGDDEAIALQSVGTLQDATEEHEREPLRKRRWWSCGSGAGNRPWHALLAELRTLSPTIKAFMAVFLIAGLVAAVWTYLKFRTAPSAAETARHCQVRALDLARVFELEFLILVRSIDGFVSTIGRMDHTMFSAYVRATQPDPQRVAAVTLYQRVTAATRDAWAEAYPEVGNLTVWARGSTGLVPRPRDTPEMWPAIESVAISKAAVVAGKSFPFIGYDPLGDPTRAEAIRATIEAGTPQMTALIQFPSENQLGFNIYKRATGPVASASPVSNDTILGVTFLVSELFNNLWKAKVDFNYVLRGSDYDILRSAPDSDLIHEAGSAFTIPLLNRAWRLSCYPRPPFGISMYRWGSQCIAAACILVALLAAAAAVQVNRILARVDRDNASIDKSRFLVRALRARAEAVLNAINVPVAVIDGLGRIAPLNTPAEELIGNEPVEVSDVLRPRQPAAQPDAASTGTVSASAGGDEEAANRQFLLDLGVSLTPDPALDADPAFNGPRTCLATVRPRNGGPAYPAEISVSGSITGDALESAATAGSTRRWILPSLTAVVTLGRRHHTRSPTPSPVPAPELPNDKYFGDARASSDAPRRVVLITDVTAAEQQKAQLRQAKADLDARRKASTQLLLYMNHEVGNPTYVLTSHAAGNGSRPNSFVENTGPAAAPVNAYTEATTAIAMLNDQVALLLGQELAQPDAERAWTVADLAAHVARVVSGQMRAPGAPLPVIAADPDVAPLLITRDANEPHPTPHRAVVLARVLRLLVALGSTMQHTRAPVVRVVRGSALGEVRVVGTVALVGHNDVAEVRAILSTPLSDNDDPAVSPTLDPEYEPRSWGGLQAQVLRRIAGEQLGARVAIRDVEWWDAGRAGGVFEVTITLRV
ncbi:hypothetical protein H9P43_006452 [Blastocladiella emersonii ATCC 22665]|nr:hypothetical protein H9P43_006452 [Blastocladiella emersonii ATCC 22665]